MACNGEGNVMANFKVDSLRIGTHDVNGNWVHDWL